MLIIREPIDKQLTIHQLIEEWVTLTTINTEENKLDIERQKLRIIEAFQALISVDLPAHYLANNSEQKSDYFLPQRVREIIYYFLLIFGLFEDCAGSYLFGSTLFSLIPGLSAPWLAVASLIFVGLSSVFFLAFQGTFLKEALEMPYTSSDASTLLELYTKQLHMTIAINKLIATIYMMPLDNALYDDYIQLATLLNKNLELRHKKLETYEQSMLKDICEIGLLAFGAISSIAGSYFMANIMISLLAPMLIGTPIGWAIIGMTIIASLIINFSMGTSSIVRLVHPDFDVHQTLKKDLASFQATYPEELKKTASIKGRFFEKAPQVSVCTQTDTMDEVPTACCA